MKKLKFILIFFCLLALVGTMMFNYFLKQMKNPHGIAGYFLFNVWNATFKDMTYWALKDITLAEYDYILDIGIGGGETLNYIATKTTQNKLFGIDISEDSIQFSEEKNKEFIATGRMQLTVADVAYLPFQDNTFNFVTTFQTHIYWEDLDKSLAEIYRVLQDRGSFLIVCEQDKIDYHLKNYQNPKDFIAVLETKGFTNLEYSEYNNWRYFKMQK